MHEFETEIDTQVCALIQDFPISLEKKELFQNETSIDEEFNY